jgi:hypothetical protein
MHAGNAYAATKAPRATPTLFSKGKYGMRVVRFLMALVGHEKQQVPAAVQTSFQQIALTKESEAVLGGAIAAEWRWRGGSSGCCRPEHEKLHGLVYSIRDNWALKSGLMNKGAGYTDEKWKPLEEEGCRCAFAYKYSLRSVPDNMVTSKGKHKLGN